MRPVIFLCYVQFHLAWPAHIMLTDSYLHVLWLNFVPRHVTFSTFSFSSTFAQKKKKRFCKRKGDRVLQRYYRERLLLQKWGSNVHHGCYVYPKGFTLSLQHLLDSANKNSVLSKTPFLTLVWHKNRRSQISYLTRQIMMSASFQTLISQINDIWAHMWANCAYCFYQVS